MSTYILALDTTTEACSVALMCNKDVLLENFIVSPGEHTIHILSMIDSLLAKAEINLRKIDALAFGCGPGSFTGIRIGLGIAQGLALGANLPLLSISTLTVLAEGAWRKTGISRVLTAIDARMGEVYWATYQRHGSMWIGKEHELVVKSEDVQSLESHLSGCWATAGTGWKTYPKLLHHKGLELIPGNALLPNARDMLPLALDSYRDNKAQHVSVAKPTYLRNKVASKIV
ncbi:universal bacterial protein YeaZ [secondary endosymbiont of Heteropsylla cubana]|uniref:tRNA threonylcarbamoyladenosine biosynthesis protein TsaB n=1 Tax=secondary endosymbiont of Heteropsylla cubana TaxID=134287 RepID=J3Z512_9ENTR|nr:tRNA (adenosine(37)-N6)-threonylcarbamoyltransferase complex dimerization subunit type 1 TsaB [secondary endosymbiont of Heteropsylla cubana]AFP85369.1 universal bacterial protein YeaZ [secondary endosymbiont of Heteropsylla cubana]